MNQRAVEVLFRNKLILLLPLLVIVPVMAAIAMRPGKIAWASSAVIWVDEYKALHTDDRLGYSPAHSQAELLNNFIHSRSFALSVLEETSLASELDDPVSAELALDTFWKGTGATATSNSFVRLTSIMDRPELAYEVAEAVLSRYQAELQSRNEAQSKTAVTFYRDALSRAEGTLATSRNELIAYLVANPHLSARSAPDGTVAAAARERDATFARLNAQVEHDERAVGETRRRFEEIQTQGQAGLQGQRLSLAVVDAPQQPVTPIVERKLSLIKLPLIGTVLGLVLSGAIATFLVVTNRAVLGMLDLGGARRVPVLGEMPELRRRRWPWQRASRDAVRLKLAAPAGATVAPKVRPRGRFRRLLPIAGG